MSSALKAALSLLLEEKRERKTNNPLTTNVFFFLVVKGLTCPIPQVFGRLVNLHKIAFLFLEIHQPTLTKT